MRGTPGQWPRRSAGAQRDRGACLGLRRGVGAARAGADREAHRYGAARAGRRWRGQVRDRDRAGPISRFCAIRSCLETRLRTCTSNVRIEAKRASTPLAWVAITGMCTEVEGRRSWIGSKQGGSLHAGAGAVLVACGPLPASMGWDDWPTAGRSLSRGLQRPSGAVGWAGRSPPDGCRRRMHRSDGKSHAGLAGGAAGAAH
jgi:hypothetical protein